jgi:hypothetical protein
MPEPIIREIHTLQIGDEFIYQRKKFRILTPLPFTVVTRHRHAHTREVMNLKTFKTERINFFEKVKVTGNFYNS